MEWHNKGTGQWGLPRVGTVNGHTVSNYHCLDEKTLLAEGWALEERPVESEKVAEPVEEPVTTGPTIEERLATLEGKVKTLETVKVG